MTPTRKYMDRGRQSTGTSIFALAFTLLLVAAMLGALIWFNIEVWNAIF